MWELDHKEGWVQKNWCFWIVVLEKMLERPLDSKEIQPVHPKGDQSWIFTGRTDAETEAPVLWPPDAGKDWRQEEKGTTEDEMVGWHHWLNGHEFEQTLGDSERQGSLECSSWNSWDMLSDWTITIKSHLKEKSMKAINVKRQRKREVLFLYHQDTCKRAENFLDSNVAS